ncbi:MAG TPA: TorF family putative porin [Candidatus Didemnitutus sp.]|nr:TorF family putative porin [Candidatus Didemnitutus sp.]
MKNPCLPIVLGLALAGATSISAQTAASTPAPAPATAAPAPAPADAPAYSWTLTPAFASQYMFRGVRLGGPSFEPSLEFDDGNLAVGVWSNFPLADKVDGQSDPEFDFYGSYKQELIKDKLYFVPGYTIYTYPNADRNNGFYKATFEPNLAINITPIDNLTLTPKVYYDFVLKGATWEFTAAYTVPLKDAGTELDFTGTVGTYLWTDAVAEADPSFKNWGDYYLVGVAMPFAVGKNGKITVGVAYTKGSNNFIKQGSDPKFQNSAAVGRGVVTIGYAYTF